MGTNRKYIIQRNGEVIGCHSKYEICQMFNISKEDFRKMLDEGSEVKGITVDSKLDNINYEDMMADYV